MRSGNLRTKIDIEALTTTKNNIGELIETWALSKPVYAEMKPMISAAKESFVNSTSQVESRLPIQFRIRFITLSVKTNRIRYNNKIYQIENIINPEERNRELLVLCYEVQI